MRPSPIYPISEVCPSCPVGHRGCIAFRVPMYCVKAAKGDAATVLRLSGVEPPPEPPKPEASCQPGKMRRQSEVPRAHPSTLTDEQRAAVASCSHRGTAQACCGPVDVCGLGRGWGKNGKRIDTGVCCWCVLGGIPR